jgi:hypothetical protein
MSLTRTDREALRLAVSEATRAALPPNARPGHPSRFGFIKQADTRQRAARIPGPEFYESLPPSQPHILAALNG